VNYLYYDVDEDEELKIAGEDTYDELAKECIGEVIVDA
jgi:hypothetical protein